MTPRELLRAAVAKLDARNAAATPGPWGVEDVRWPNKVDGFSFPRERDAAQRVLDADAELIVDAVALYRGAVRDVLVAEIRARQDLHYVENEWADHHNPALRIARAILGEEA